MSASAPKEGAREQEVVDEEALPAHLERADISAFEVERRREEDTWRYYYREGVPVSDPDVLAYLTGIPVPATWTEVKLSLNPGGHILATGYDGSGKHQYLYHTDYLDYRNDRKFAELLHFGLALPRMRRQMQRDLSSEEWTERKLLALLLRILDKYHLRVGSRVYAQRNQSFGLTTLRKKHLKEVEDELAFEYVGKAGQKQSVVLADPQLVRLVREVAEFPGWELFSIRTEGHAFRADAAAINTYIHQLARADFTARSFRTWAGTVMTVKYYGKARKIVEKNPRRELGAVLTELVAKELGNTPAICRAYYMHPGVFEKVVAGDFNPDPCDPAFLRNSLYRRYECRTLEILASLADDAEAEQKAVREAEALALRAGTRKAKAGQSKSGDGKAKERKPEKAKSKTGKVEEPKTKKGKAEEAETKERKAGEGRTQESKAGEGRTQESEATEGRTGKRKAKARADRSTGVARKEGSA